LLSHSFHYATIEEETSYDITTPDHSQIHTSNDTLRHALKSKTEFDDCYESITQKCFRCFDRCKRPATVAYLKSDVAMLYFIRQNYSKASDLFAEICFSYGNSGWNHIDTVLIERYAICQRQLGRTNDLIRCYIHLVRFPHYLELESHQFYMNQLKDCCILNSGEIFIATDSPLFEIVHMHLIDNLKENGSLVTKIHLRNGLPCEFLFDRVIVNFQTGEGVEMVLEGGSTTLCIGEAELLASGLKSSVPGEYFPMYMTLSRGSLSFYYNIPASIQRLCKIRLFETPDSLVMKSSISPTSGTQEIDFEILTKSANIEKSNLIISPLTSIEMVFPENLKVQYNNSSITCVVNDKTIVLPPLTSGSSVTFSLGYVNNEPSIIDHKLKMELVETKETGRKLKYNSTIYLQLTIPVEVIDSVTYSASKTIIDFNLMGHEQETRFDSFEFGTLEGLVQLLPQDDQVIE
jgi:hypothetical protein